MKVSIRLAGWLLAAVLHCAPEDNAERELIKTWKASVLPPDKVNRYTGGEDLCWFGVPYLRGI
jgi:hypothetical protein